MSKTLYSLLLYLGKALVWTLLPAVITGKREKQKAEITETGQTGTAGVGIW